METKKSPHADLEGKRTFFLEIGIIMAVVIMLAAFEWRTYDVKELVIPKRAIEQEDEEKADITDQKEELPIPPAPPVATTLLNLVDDETEVTDEPIINIEDTPTNPIGPWTPKPPDEEDPIDTVEPPFIVVEDDPEFPGGESARMKFLSENISYPQAAKETGIEGIVYLTFVLEKDGSVTDVRVLRGIGGGCDEEAIRVTKLMPKWIPGRQRGKPVRVQMQMKIKFILAS